MNSRQITQFHKRLHRWYAAQGRRDLPWRNTVDAYAIYVSEIMLQQTQVKTVRERYYGPFLDRFPTLEHLAKASRQDVMRAWQGLGYYNRAVNLHEAAKRSGSHLPESIEALMALPGIGRNTAHALAAFAHRQPVAVLEANVRRVLSRIFALAAPAESELWEKAQALLDRQNPFDYNQAMMDIGATVCRKRDPLCTACPAQSICAGKAAPESYPLKKARQAPPVRWKHILIKRNPRNEYHAVPRQTKFLNGLYHFCETDAPGQVQGEELGHIRQQYSHFTLEADVWLLEASGNGKDWHTLERLKSLPFSMAEQKMLRLLEQRHCEEAQPARQSGKQALK